MRHRRVGQAFTLIELLVVIAIIAILIALLVPAVQKVRDAAARTQCANNIKQIGIALHAYHDQYGYFPHGSVWLSSAAPGNASNRGSILVYLLPYLEQEDLYRMFDFTTNTDPQTDPSGRLLGSYVIPAYQCPSDRTSSVLPNGRGRHNYAASAGPTAHSDNAACSCASYVTWNGYALAPYANANNYAGVFTRQGVQAKTKPRMKHITDGLSNTIAFGEVRASCSAHNSQGWSTSNNGQGLTATLTPINSDTCDTTPAVGGGNNCGRPCNWNLELSFGSHHAGGANFVAVDGAVRFLNQDIDHWTFQYLGAKADDKQAVFPQ